MARFDHLETVVRENNSRCLLMEEEAQLMKEMMNRHKAAQATELSNASQIRIVNEEARYLTYGRHVLFGVSQLIDFMMH